MRKEKPGAAMRLHGDLARLRRLSRPAVVKKYLAGNHEPALHIGCGGEIRPGWLNVDRYNAAADTYLDARNPFPFDDGVFALVFSEHTIEHLDIGRVRNFLTEIRRVLRPGGICRITCPSLELYARKYIEGDTAFFERVNQGIEHKRRKYPDLAWLVRTDGAAFMTGVVKDFHGHRWMFDYPTLEACLREVGFSQVAQRAFGNSASERMAAMDNPDRSFETLYVEATR